jgi:ABC-type multidrug transport system permease subunit
VSFQVPEGRICDSSARCTTARISSEELAGGILNVIGTPMMVICGVFFSIDGTPRLLQMLAQLLPLTHLVSGARAIMLDGAGLHAIAPNLLALTAMSAIYLVLGAAMFKWRQN